MTRRQQGLIALTALTAAVGLAGVACSAMIYVDTRRRFWRWSQTFPRFFGTVITVALAIVMPPLAAFALLAKMAWEETGLGRYAGLVHQDDLRAGRFGFLASGILYAHAITTVSPTYAREILTPEHGVGLDGLLRTRREVLFGILNGIDEGEWSPERDARLQHRFSAQDLSGKERCKESLLATMRLPYRREVPVFGIVSRLAWQKGFDLCINVLPAFLQRRAFQLVVLGTGEPRYQEFFTRVARGGGPLGSHSP